MDSHQLHSVLTHDPVCRLQFAGVYAADELPDTIGVRPHLYIVNTDVSRGMGIHWVAFLFSYGRTSGVFLFDRSATRTLPCQL